MKLYDQVNRPTDKLKTELLPSDFVWVEQIPEYYFAEAEVKVLENYGNKFGMVSFFLNESHYYRRPEHQSWVNEPGNEVHVKIMRITENEAINSCEFWLPTSSLRRVIPNPLLLALYVSVPHALSMLNGSSELVFRPGARHYALAKFLLQLPPELLEFPDMRVLSEAFEICKRDVM